MNGSGYTGILLGMPAKPGKCIVMNVIFTPVKNNKKCNLEPELLM
jgi:hypothetical protein